MFRVESLLLSSVESELTGTRRKATLCSHGAVVKGARLGARITMATIYLSSTYEDLKDGCRVVFEACPHAHDEHVNG